MNKTYLSTLIRHVLHPGEHRATPRQQMQERAWSNHDKDRLDASLENLASIDEAAADTGE